MARRLIIDGLTENIISDLESQSLILTAAAPDVTLEQHPDDEDFFRFELDSQGRATIKVRIRIQRTTATLLQTRIDQITDLLQNIRGKTVAFEFDDTLTRFELPVIYKEDFEVEAVLTADDESAYYDCTFSSEPEDAAGTGAAAPAGAIKPVEWDLLFGPGGYARAAAVVEFKDRATAQAWGEGFLKSGGPVGFPVWAPPGEWRLFNRTYGFKDDLVTSKHTVTVEIRQRIDTLFGNSALADLVDFNYQINRTVMEPAVRAATVSGTVRFETSEGRGTVDAPVSWMVIVNGDLTFKVGKNSAWAPGDVADTAKADWEEEARLAIDAIVADAADRIDDDTARFNDIRLREIARQVEPATVNGVVSFAVTCLMPVGSDVTDFQENLEYRYKDSTPFLVRSDGVRRFFPGPEGLDVFLTHRISVQKLGSAPAPYRLPNIGGCWRNVGGTIPRVHVTPHESGVLLFSLSGTTTWVREVEDTSGIIEKFDINQPITPAQLER